MRAVLLATMLLSAVALAVNVTVAAAAPPPPPPPAPMLSFQGRDQVLIGRVYWREAGATQPLARFGTILSGGSSSVPVAIAGPAGNMTLSLGARRKGEHEAVVTWTLQAGAGATLPAGQGKVSIQEGSIGHVALGTSGTGELFASLETGRASSFHLQRLWEHFGVATDMQRVAPAPAPAWTAPGSAAPAVAAPAPQRGGTLTVSCPSGTRFELSTGTGKGACETGIEGDRVTGGRCDDGAGNSAAATCAVNAGRGTCLGTAGAGSCIQPL